MTAPQPQFIAEEEDLQILEKILGYKSGAIHRIRSRPAPSPFPKTIPDNPYSIQSEFEKRSDFLIWLKAYDAAIVAQVREDVEEKLDVIRKHAQEQYREADLSDDLDLMAMHLDYENRIWDIMKSLRRTEAPK